MSEARELDELRAEHARLVALLESHGIPWRRSASQVALETEPIGLGSDAKIALFRRLFQGREDVYAVRWESKAGQSGYAPACANEWRPGICEKPRIKCAACGHRQLLPLTDAVLRDHLTGKCTVGIYPLLVDDSCHFLAVDFDEAEWQDDARAFMQSCGELDLPAALEISRSGRGAHAWVFFAHKVAARDARRLGTALISHTCARTRQLTLGSYDRLFPNQDTMPKGGFGNLIALPLQRQPRDQGCSVFVDAAFRPYPDQWAFLAGLKPMAPNDLEPTILRVTGRAHPLDVTFIDEEDQRQPWKRADAAKGRLPGVMPKALTVTHANGIYFEKASLPQPLANRLIRLAAFQNPEFYRAQAMRLPIWNKPRVIGCAENYPHHIALPRGCLEAAQNLLRENDVRCDLRDERFTGLPLDLRFTGTLRDEQQAATEAMLHHEIGVLCAPTGFGKTVTAAAIIARRGVNTLVLVHRTELLAQWREQLGSLLSGGPSAIGTVGGGKAKPTGKIDIAVMQSVSRKGAVDAMVETYGHVIVDECHHVGAISFDQILRRAKARYVLGLTATPIRRDGQQPVIFMQCGPIRHTVERSATAPMDRVVIQRTLNEPIDLPANAGIQDVFRHLAQSDARTRAIVAEIVGAFHAGRKVLVLTERTDHVESIAAGLRGAIDNLHVLHGRLSKKQRAVTIDALSTLSQKSPRVLIATGKLVGEGFDHPPLDTLVLAMPISWKGTLQQYAGRLHRDHAGKTDVQIIDFVDTGNSALERMWLRRQRGYRAMGYRIDDKASLIC